MRAYKNTPKREETMNCRVDKNAEKDLRETNVVGSRSSHLGVRSQ